MVIVDREASLGPPRRHKGGTVCPCEVGDLDFSEAPVLVAVAISLEGFLAGFEQEGVRLLLEWKTARQRKRKDKWARVSRTLTREGSSECFLKTEQTEWGWGVEREEGTRMRQKCWFLRQEKQKRSNLGGEMQNWDSVWGM